MIYNDNSIIPEGQYKGWEIGNVPAQYLLLVYGISTNKTTPLCLYVLENLDRLKAEMKRKQDGQIK